MGLKCALCCSVTLTRIFLKVRLWSPCHGWHLLSQTLCDLCFHHCFRATFLSAFLMCLSAVAVHVCSLLHKFDRMSFVLKLIYSFTFCPSCCGYSSVHLLNVFCCLVKKNNLEKEGKYHWSDAKWNICIRFKSQNVCNSLPNIAQLVWFHSWI